MTGTIISKLGPVGLDFFTPGTDHASNVYEASYTSGAIKFEGVNILTFADAGLNLPEDKILTMAKLPTADSHVANKGYVDSFAQGLNVKKSVRVASTENVTLGVNGTTSVNVIDGVTLQQNDRVLLKDQTNLAQNGIYVRSSGNALTRASDMDVASEVRGAFTFVESGTHADHGFVQTGGAIDTFGESFIEFTQFSGTGNITAGAGITKDGNKLEVTDGYVLGLVNAELALSVLVTTSTDTQDNIRKLLDADTDETEENTFGSLTYDPASGIFTLVPVAKTDIIGSFTEGTGVAIAADGKISIGQPVGKDNDVSFVSVTTTSDERKKKNIEDLKNSDDLYKLRCVSYNWKDENADPRTKYGFIAQEVQKILPSIVNDLGTHIGIDYLNLISLLVKEVQILRHDVNKLSAA